MKNLIVAIWEGFPSTLILVRGVILLLAFTAHELGHGLVATLLGDPTPRERGRLTLNPIPHLESIGVILGILIGFGWSRTTPIRPHRMRLPDWLGGPLTMLAGPLANLALVGLGMLLLNRLGLSPDWPWNNWPTLAEWLTVLIGLNLSIALLNLLPLFPLDGYQMIRYLLPLRAVVWWERASGWTTALLGFALAIVTLMPPALQTLLLRPLIGRVTQAILGW